MPLDNLLHRRAEQLATPSYVAVRVDLPRIQLLVHDDTAFPYFAVLVKLLQQQLRLAPQTPARPSWGC